MPVKPSWLNTKDACPFVLALVLPSACGLSELRAATAFELEAHTIESGGRVGLGVYVVDAVIGQPDADPLHPASGGVFELVGGFLPSASMTSPIIDAVFADGFED